jgi:hypothetical protein
MSVLADDAAAHDWSVTGAGICGKPERSMATLTWHRTPVPFAAGVSPATEADSEVLHLVEHGVRNIFGHENPCYQMPTGRAGHMGCAVRFARYGA